MRTTRPHRGWLALGVAGAMFALTAMAGPDAVQHLWTTAKDFHACALYHWTHGAGSGARSCISLVAPLPVAGSATLEVAPAAPDVSSSPPASRGPPAIA